MSNLDFAHLQSRRANDISSGVTFKTVLDLIKAITCPFLPMRSPGLASTACSALVASSATVCASQPLLLGGLAQWGNGSVIYTGEWVAFAPLPVSLQYEHAKFPYSLRR